MKIILSFSILTTIIFFSISTFAADKVVVIPLFKGSCEIACSAGTYDLNGIAIDGCEFSLDNDAIYVSSSDTDASDSPGCGLGPYITGTGNWPCATIGKGLAEAISTGRSKVLVAGGFYTENVTIVDGKNLLGGYNAITWERNITSTPTLIIGSTGSGHRKTVIASGINAAATLFEGFIVFGANATTPGANSYGVYVSGSSNNLTISNNTIIAGSGAPGSDGSSGTDGIGGILGYPGIAAYEAMSGCTVSSSGGAGGILSCGGTVVTGGNGGSAICRPSFNTQQSAQNGTTGNNNGGTGGTGGWDGSTSIASNSCQNCSYPTGGSMTGSAGQDGSSGSNGNAGMGCSNGSGIVAGNEWAGIAGSNGGAGVHGSGGGGGGAGGGGEDLDVNLCYDDLGGTGGGGGSGACGGSAGLGGSGGGGSFGVFIYNCSSAPVVSDNTIYRGNGGRGGTGGVGGAGGVGGNGAVGGAKSMDANSFCTGEGGEGGKGGDGGHAGGGGGGCGGVSFGIWASSYGGGSPGYDINNTFNTVGAPGTGGNGGPSPGNSGTNGSVGASGDSTF